MHVIVKKSPHDTPQARIQFLIKVVKLVSWQILYFKLSKNFKVIYSFLFSLRFYAKGLTENDMWSWFGHSWSKQLYNADTLRVAVVCCGLSRPNRNFFYFLFLNLKQRVYIKFRFEIEETSRKLNLKNISSNVAAAVLKQMKHVIIILFLL